MKIVIASKNKKKIEEIKRILNNPPIPPLEKGGEEGFEQELPPLKIFTLDGFPMYPEVEETGETFEANAVKKAITVAKYTGMPALADDSGLEVYALNGAPGVLSSRYAGKDSDDKRNIEKLLYEMRSFTGNKRKARFVCSVALAYPDGSKKTFFGSIEGTIGTEPKGTGGFGYDPVFYPEGYSKTFSEMDDDEKDAISHRGMALRKAYQYLREKERDSSSEFISGLE